MNRYGRMAYEHTKQHRPTGFGALTDPTAFFSTIGEEAAAQITRLRDEMLGPQRSGENLEAYRRRSYQAQHQAEELVLAELVWLPAETGAVQPEDEQVLDYRARLAALSKTLATAGQSWTDTALEASGPT
ncbi:MAG: hypothetical protein WD830_11805 [Chloroflexota bacterium]